MNQAEFAVKSTSTELTNAYAYVGNTPDATYKLLNGRTGELTTKDTIVKFEQNVNTFAQLINTPDIKTTLTMFEQEAVTILPKP